MAVFLRAALLAALSVLPHCTAPQLDIVPIMMNFGFEPHHRNFVKNLYEKNMLGLVSASDLQTIGMSEQQQADFHALVKHIQTGAPLPPRALPIATQPSPPADSLEGRVALPLTGSANAQGAGAAMQQRQAQADADRLAVAEIARLNSEKAKAVAGEDYITAAQLKSRIDDLEAAREKRRASVASAVKSSPSADAAQYAGASAGLHGQPNSQASSLHTATMSTALSGMAASHTHALLASPPQPPPLLGVEAPADFPNLPSELATKQDRVSQEQESQRLTNAKPVIDPNLDPAVAQKRRYALEAMVSGLGISSRFVPFVSNLVEKETYGLVQHSELTQLGLSSEELRAFDGNALLQPYSSSILIARSRYAVIREWADTRHSAADDNSADSESSAIRQQMHRAESQRIRAQREVERRTADAPSNGTYAISQLC